jgi:hypothetical protein
VTKTALPPMTASSNAFLYSGIISISSNARRPCF